MPTKLKLVGFIAVIAGIMATFGIYKYMEKQRETLGNSTQNLHKVVLARQDLPLGKKLLGIDLKIVEWPEEIIPAGSMADTASLIGRAIKTPVYAEEIILETKLAPQGSGGGFSSIIPSGMRAMTVSVNNFSGVSGFILPNTRVDVLVTVPSPWRSKESYTKIILEDVPVLAVDQSYVREDNKPILVQGVTLLVNPRQAEKLGLAANEGQLQLTLRNSADRSRKNTYGVKTRELIARPVFPKKTVISEVNNQGSTKQNNQRVIEIIRSTERTEIKVGDDGNLIKPQTSSE